MYDYQNAGVGDKQCDLQMFQKNTSINPKNSTVVVRKLSVIASLILTLLDEW